MGNLSSSQKHGINCLCYFIFVFLSMRKHLFADDTNDTIASENVPPFTEHGFIFTAFTYILKLCTCLAFPELIALIGGFLFRCPFPGPVQLKRSPLLSPYLCVRVVTRGTFPDLVKFNVKRNLQTCLNVGLQKFHFEVVTANAIGLDSNGERVREIIVPNNYETKNKTLFKARQLQYCLEDGVCTSQDDDWIVHLDEDTVMSEDSIRGILNFVTEGRNEIGQGIITYGRDGVTNWLTTLSDCSRASNDLGRIAFVFTMFRKPLLGMKGTFFIVKASAEKDVTHDFGPSGSVAEDAVFGFLASAKGYRFGFIEGEMYEQSTQSILDYIRQRKRWTQGLYLCLRRNDIPHRETFIQHMSFISMFASMFYFLWHTFVLSYWPIRLHYIDTVLDFFSISAVYHVYLGFVMSFRPGEIGVRNYILGLIFLPVGALLTIVAHQIGVIWGMLTPKTDFYVVQKSVAISNGINHVTQTKLSDKVK